jgi:hypothetical protein
MSWEETFWAELEALTDTEQIVVTGELIDTLNHRIVPELARIRRRKAAEVVAQSDWDATRLAETIGARRTTITRLAEEGRALTREETIRAILR